MLERWYGKWEIHGLFIEHNGKTGSVSLEAESANEARALMREQVAVAFFRTNRMVAHVDITSLTKR